MILFSYHMLLIFDIDFCRIMHRCMVCRDSASLHGVTSTSSKSVLDPEITVCLVLVRDLCFLTSRGGRDASLGIWSVIV